MAASPFAANGSEALSPTTAQASRRRDAESCDVVVGAGRALSWPAPGPASGARCFASRDRPLWQADGEMVGSGSKGCGLHSGCVPVQTPVLSCAGPFSGRRGPTTRVAPAECE